jgi:hypothetical protein
MAGWNEMVVDGKTRNDKQKSEKSIQPENAEGMQPLFLPLGAANSF